MQAIKSVALPAWSDPPQLAATASRIRDDIEKPVGTLSHIPHPLTAIDEQVLFSGHASIRDGEAHEPLLPETADEQIAAPFGKRGARIELRTGRSNDRIPVVDRLLDAFSCSHRVRDRPARVLNSVRDDWPPVILALLYEIELVAT